MDNRSKRERVSADYQIACICPMGVELAPVEGMLDEIHHPLPTKRSQNAYTLGSIGGHNIVISIMPEVGNNAAAATVTQLLNDFPAIRFGLLVGIGGGVPGDVDVRLGDLVVSQPTGESSGVVQYDMGKELKDGFQRMGSLNKPPAVLSASVRKLEGQYRRLGHDLSRLISEMVQRYPKMQPEYLFPAASPRDQLFLATYEHQHGPSCDQCDDQHTVSRPDRDDREPRIHYGTIGSANKVVKDAAIRDRIRADTHALCVEMEAAGIMTDFPCLVIRGICDYADSHKNKVWQPYAAAVAAAYMRALLLTIPTEDVVRTDRIVEGNISPFKVGLHLTEAPVIEDNLFIGRATELKEMASILRPEASKSKHQRLVLGGMGGIGKTQLAIAYAKRYRDVYDSIFWLNAMSETVLKHSVRLMAQRILEMEQYQRLNDDQIVLQVTRWLVDTANTRWLLIFDNYDEPDAYDIGKYCPYSAHGNAIITTRLPDQVQGQQLAVPLLNDLEQSLTILQTRSERKDVQADPHAHELVRRMQGLPLALAAAGAHLRHSPWTFEQYLHTYDKYFGVDSHRPSELLEYQNRTLYTTWNMSYSRLEADDPRAANLLKSLAFFGNQHLSYALFRASNDVGRTNALADTKMKIRSLLRSRSDRKFLKWLLQMSSEEFESAMRALTRYCFVEVQVMHGEYSIHNCVHDWALVSLNASSPNEGYWFAFDRIAELVNDILAQDGWRHSQYNLIAAHAAQLAHTKFSAIAQDVSRGRLDHMRQIAQFLYCQSQTGAAEQMHQRLLAVQRKTLGPIHISTLATLVNLAKTYRDLDRFSEAEQVTVQAMTELERQLGPEHEFTLEAASVLGAIYATQSKLNEAEQILTPTLTGQKRVLGLEHRSTLLTANSLGAVYRDQHKLVDAEQLLRQSLTGFEKVVGPEHHLTLDTVENLGILYKDQGKFIEAEQMYKRALVGYEKTVGPEHALALSTIHNLGFVYSAQGKMAEAEQMYQRALVGSEKARGPEHTSTLTIVHCLGSLYSDQGKFAEADRMYQRALVGYEKALGPEHTYTLTTVHCLGRLYFDQGKFTEADQMYQRTLIGYEKTLGPEHASTLIIVASLGRLYRDQDRLAEAEHMFKRAIDGREKALGPDDPLTQRMANDLNSMYKSQAWLDRQEASHRVPTQDDSGSTSESMASATTIC